MTTTDSTLRGITLAAALIGACLLTACNRETPTTAKSQPYGSTASAPAAPAPPTAATTATTAAPSLCASDERVLFACAVGGGKMVSMCASRELSESSGRLYYIYGTRDKPELAFPDKTSAPQDRFKRTHLMFAGNTGGYAYSFDNGGHTYVVYSVSGTQLERQGLAVYKDDFKKPLSVQRCEAGSVTDSNDDSLLKLTRSWKPDARVEQHGVPAD